MARAYGANAQLLGKFETVYGTPPTGNYIKFPFVSSDLGSEQGLIASDLLGQGRDPSQPIRDVIRVEGNVVVPVDLRNFGHWLKALLGAPTTTDSRGLAIDTSGAIPQLMITAFLPAYSWMAVPMSPMRAPSFTTAMPTSRLFRATSVTSRRASSLRSQPFFFFGVRANSSSESRRA